MKKFIALFMAGVLCAGMQLYALGSPEKTGTGNSPKLSVLVYITGMLAGSPTYQELADGAKDFAKSHSGVAVKVYEAGFNQAQWEEQLTSLVASGRYNLVLGSNPSLPEICANVAKKFPKQKFVITDSEMSGNPQIRTWLFNQWEQEFYLGYLAGLITTSTELPHANAAKKVGFIAAQEYPLLNNDMVPGFIAGARLVDPAIILDYRVIGDWSNANKAGELASSMLAAGVDVFISDAGGAAQGIIKTLQSEGGYMLYTNDNAYSLAPGVILGCGLVQSKKLTEEILEEALAGKIEWGKATTVGVEDGYLDFVSDDPAYTKYVPEDIRNKMAAFMQDMKAGKYTKEQFSK
jgi:simple sugar transport system substrate-binding protein